VSDRDRSARALTPAETALAASVFGDAIDYASVRLVRRKWAFFQPRDTVMAPRGCIHFHPKGDLWCDDFAHAHLTLQGLFIHEMTMCLSNCNSGYTAAKYARRHHIYSVFDRTAGAWR
jgi:hypothetical protein